MNAGSFNKEMKDIIVETTCIDKNGNIKVFSNDEQDLSYRNSIFKQNNYIILEAKLKFKKGNINEISKKMSQLMEKRKQTQPLEFPSAGSIFKKGENYVTPKLIEQCGLKGYSIGGAQISEKHAGFIINKGNAKSQDIIDLINYTKNKVYEKFQIKIEQEVEIM